MSKNPLDKEISRLPKSYAGEFACAGEDKNKTEINKLQEKMVVISEYAKDIPASQLQKKLAPLIKEVQDQVTEAAVLKTELSRNSLDKLKAVIMGDGTLIGLRYCVENMQTEGDKRQLIDARHQISATQTAWNANKDSIITEIKENIDIDQAALAKTARMGLLLKGLLAGSEELIPTEETWSDSPSRSPSPPPYSRSNTPSPDRSPSHSRSPSPDRSLSQQSSLQATSTRRTRHSDWLKSESINRSHGSQLDSFSNSQSPPSSRSSSSDLRIVIGSSESEASLSRSHSPSSSQQSSRSSSHSPNRSRSSSPIVIGKSDENWSETHDTVKPSDSPMIPMDSPLRKSMPTRRM